MPARWLGRRDAIFDPLKPGVPPIVEGPLAYLEKNGQYPRPHHLEHLVRRPPVPLGHLEREPGGCCEVGLGDGVDAAEL